MQWDHAPFIVQTTKFDPDICGEITYEARFNGEPIEATIAEFPLKYDPDAMVFTFFTEDTDLLEKSEKEAESWLES